MNRLMISMVLTMLCGCAAITGGGPFHSYLDAPSKTRLDQVGDHDRVLITVTLENARQDFPPLEGGQILGRAGRTVLLNMPKSSLSTLSHLRGLQRALVWGEGSILDKMTVPFRNHLLERVDQSLVGTPFSMVAGFSNYGEEELRQAVAGTGATARSIHGKIVTVEADANAAFRLMTLEGLDQVDTPTQLLPLRRN